LMNIWQTFCDKNHGLQAWKKCNQIYQQIFSNEAVDIETTTAEQAILNWMLTKSVNMHDGILFDNIYPGNTADIWKCVEQHLKKTVDSRFRC